MQTFTYFIQIYQEYKKTEIYRAFYFILFV